MPSWIFDSLASPTRTLVVGTAAYAALLFFLRISGKRTVSKWNSFDLVVTVAIGSSFATVMLSNQTSLLQGLLGLLLLVMLQFVITWLSVRIPAVERIVKSEPAFLVLRGEFVTEALARERVTETEILAALRSHGIADVAEAGAVVLETDGKFSIILMEKMPQHSLPQTLSNVSGEGNENRRKAKKNPVFPPSRSP